MGKLSGGSALSGCLIIVLLFLLIFAIESLVMGLIVLGAWNLILVAIVPTVATITFGKAWLFGLILSFISSLFTARITVNR